MRFRLGRDIITRGKKSKQQTNLTKPTYSEISVFERLAERAVSGKGKPNVLIIGSSPELRSLTAKFGLRTTVVANDLEVIERTTKLMKKKNEMEHWFEGDIKKLPFKRNTFDIVFGDHVISNISPFNQESFYRRMKEVLKRNGLAVIRSVVFSKTEKNFESKLSKHFRIVEKEFGKQGVFAEHFPIYTMRPK